MGPVYLTAWLASLLFLLSRVRFPRFARLTVWLDLLGAVLLWIHIVVAYGVKHDWSHAHAVEHVVARTEQTTGIASGLGLYVNFLTASVWSYFALRRATSAGLNAYPMTAEIFLWSMFLCASVVFAQPSSAWIFGIAWVLLLVHRLQRPPVTRQTKSYG